MRILSVPILGLLAVSLCVGCGDDDPGADRGAAECGNSLCEVGETEASCPADCVPVAGQDCGDGVCEGTENASTCAADCATLASLAGVWSECIGGYDDPDASAYCSNLAGGRIAYNGTTVLRYDVYDGSCDRWAIEENAGVLIQRSCWDDSNGYGYELWSELIALGSDTYTQSITTGIGTTEYSHYAARGGETYAQIEAMCVEVDELACSSVPAFATSVDPALVGTWQSCDGSATGDPTVECAVTYETYVRLNADGTAVEMFLEPGDEQCYILNYASSTAGIAFIEYQYCDATETFQDGDYITVTQSGGETYTTEANEYTDCTGGPCITVTEYRHMILVPDVACPPGAESYDYTCE